MFEADSQIFASAPPVPRGFELQNFWPTFGGDHRGTLGGGGVPAKPPSPASPSAGAIGGPSEEGGSQPTPPPAPREHFSTRHGRRPLAAFVSARAAMIDPQPCGSEAAPLVGPGIAAPALQGPVLSAHTAFSAPASCRVVGIGAVLLALVLLHVLSLDRAAPSVAAPGVRAAQPRRAWAAGDAEWVVPVVAVDKGGHSYWTSMTIPLGPSGGPNSIGALSDVIKVCPPCVRRPGRSFRTPTVVLSALFRHARALGWRLQANCRRLLADRCRSTAHRWAVMPPPPPTTDQGNGKGRNGVRPMGTAVYGGKGQGKGKGRGEGRVGQGGRGRAQGGEKPMGTTAYGGKGSQGRAVNGDRPVGAAGCRQEPHTKGVMPKPPPHRAHGLAQTTEATGTATFVLYALLLDPGCCLRAQIILIELVEPEGRKKTTTEATVRTSL